HWPDATGDGGNGRGYFLDGVELHVADGFAIDLVDADIYNHRAATNHVGLEEMSRPYSDHDDVGLAGEIGEIAAAAVANRGEGIRSGAPLHEDQSLRLSREVGSGARYHQRRR